MKIAAEQSTAYLNMIPGQKYQIRRAVSKIEKEQNNWKEGNVLFNDTFNTFYLWLYGVKHMVKDHSHSERGNLLPPYGSTMKDRSDDPSHHECSYPRAPKRLSQAINYQLGEYENMIQVATCLTERPTVHSTVSKQLTSIGKGDHSSVV